MDFSDFFENTSDRTKLNFLIAIIKHNKNLQNEFISFSSQKKKSEEPLSIEHFDRIITKTQEKYLSYFNQVDLENPDWKNFNPPHTSYIEEWEQYQLASEQEFEQIFEGFKSEAIDSIIQQQITDLVAMIAGLYEVCLNVEIEDDLCSFNDVNEYLTDEHQRIMHELIDKINMSAISSNNIIDAILLFFIYCDEEHPGNPTYPNYFEPLLLAIADISDQSNKILSLLDASKLERESLPQLVLLLNKKAGNHIDWLKSAQQFYLKDNEVAKHLLNYYFESDKRAFIKTAHELFYLDKFFWAKFLQNKVDAQLDRSLYFNVFYQLTISEKKIGYYHKIKEYLSPSYLAKLLLEIDWQKPFVVQILEVEKKYEDIKQIVEDNPDDWDYVELIKPILTIYPAFCFNNIKTKAENTLANNRGRSTYQRIASWLQLAKLIPGFENQTHALITQLYNHKPNLPALKDEFRETGLI